MYSRVKKVVALKMSTNALVQIAYACITSGVENFQVYIEKLKFSKQLKYFLYTHIWIV